MIMAGMTDTLPSSAVAPSSGVASHPQGACPLPQLGVIRAVGEDAVDFLQNQLTQDMAHVPVGEARLAAFCNAKGRMRASFLACRHSTHEYWLVCSADLLAATLKRLSMFVMRSRLKLIDASAEIGVWGLLGDAALPPTTATEPNTLLAPLPPADGAPRALWLAPTDSAAPAGGSLPPEAWDFAAVRSGVAWVSAATAEAFVPQMLNYESVGGVDFKKGCYPGQEVVARSQFRGAIKRRAFVGQVAGVAEAGQDVFAADEPEQPCGVVAQAAPAPGGGTAVIVSLQLAALESGQTLHAGSASGPVLRDLQRPYPLIEI